MVVSVSLPSVLVGGASNAGATQAGPAAAAPLTVDPNSPSVSLQVRVVDAQGLRLNRGGEIRLVITLRAADDLEGEKFGAKVTPWLQVPEDRAPQWRARGAIFSVPEERGFQAEFVESAHLHIALWQKGAIQHAGVSKDAAPAAPAATGAAATGVNRGLGLLRLQPKAFADALQKTAAIANAGAIVGAIANAGAADRGELVGSLKVPVGRRLVGGKEDSCGGADFSEGAAWLELVDSADGDPANAKRKGSLLLELGMSYQTGQPSAMPAVPPAKVSQASTPQTVTPQPSDSEDVAPKVETITEAEAAAAGSSEETPLPAAEQAAVDAADGSPGQELKMGNACSRVSSPGVSSRCSGIAEEMPSDGTDSEKCIPTASSSVPQPRDQGPLQVELPAAAMATAASSSADASEDAASFQEHTPHDTRACSKPSSVQTDLIDEERLMELLRGPDTPSRDDPQQLLARKAQQWLPTEDMSELEQYEPMSKINIFTVNETEGGSSSSSSGPRLTFQPFQRFLQKWSSRPSVRIKPIKQKLRSVIDPDVRKERRKVRKWRRWHEVFCALNDIERRLTEVVNLMNQAACSMKRFGQCHASLKDGIGISAFLIDVCLYFRSECGVPQRIEKHLAELEQAADAFRSLSIEDIKLMLSNELTVSKTTSASTPAAAPAASGAEGSVDEDEELEPGEAWRVCEDLQVDVAVLLESALMASQQALAEYKKMHCRLELIATEYDSECRLEMEAGAEPAFLPLLADSPSEAAKTAVPDRAVQWILDFSQLVGSGSLGLEGSVRELEKRRRRLKQSSAELRDSMLRRASCAQVELGSMLAATAASSSLSPTAAGGAATAASAS
eukprot:TRINITY_DN59558_c0_g1_i1.p1 TRINITY_DN59558_c0_g1~~TRINITY_DN59558_c0_g1_i1.p1  ORF type:complete len:845 (-),score=232.43 TRINITY_DN59558_c0_g1_i1:108-2642(-)